MHRQLLLSVFNLPIFQVAILSKYRHPEDHGVFQVIALSVLGLIVVLVVVVIMLRSLANMLIYHDVGPPG